MNRQEIIGRILNTAGKSFVASCVLEYDDNDCLDKNNNGFYVDKIDEKMIDRNGNRGAKVPTLFLKLNSREAFDELIKMFRNLKYSTGAEPGMAGKWIVPTDENNPVYRPL